MSVSLTRDNENQLPEMEALAASLNVPINIDCYMCPAVRERGKPYDFSAPFSGGGFADQYIGGVRDVRVQGYKIISLKSIASAVLYFYLIGKCS